MSIWLRSFRWLCVAGLAAFGAFAASADEEPVPKALLIGVDGLRPDALIVADTPNLNRLIANGTLDPRCLILGERYQENNTVSGPGWSSIQTGVWADKHGVHDNTFEGRNYDEYPHFLERVKAERPDATTASVVSVWRPIDEYIVAGADLRHFFPLAGGSTVDLNVSADEIDVDTRDGQWRHLLAVRGGGEVSLYLDGRLVATAEDTAGNFDLQGSLYHIGRDAREGATEFDGDLGDARVWGRALTQEEIEAAAAGQAPGGEDLVLHRQGPLQRDEAPIEAPLASVTQGGFTAAAWFRTTDTGRNILMGNYGDAGAGHLNLELHTDNRVRVYINPDAGDRMARELETDTAATDAAVEILAEEEPTAMWLYLHQPDAAGHGYGFSPHVAEYIHAIENFDGHVGRIVEAIENRPSYEDEDWLIVITTDHGGYGTGHGGGHDIPEILHGFLLVSGDGVHNRISPRQTYIVDAVPTVLQHLGLALDPDLDGEPLGLE